MITRRWLRIWPFLKKKLTKETAKKFAVQAICGFTFWTILLTPYIFPLVCKWDFTAYLNWLVMEALLVPPIAIIVANLTNVIESKLLKRDIKDVWKDFRNRNRDRI